MNKLISIFKSGLLLKSDSFRLFELSFGRFLLYFLGLNLVMFIPLTYSIFELDDSIQNLLGVQVTDTTALNNLPSDCEIVNQTFMCEEIPSSLLIIEINEAPFTLSFFNPIPEGEDGIVFEETTAELFISNQTLRLDYRGFGYTPFVDLTENSSSMTYQTLFEGFYPSIRPYVALPLMMVFVGGYILTNIILLITLSSLSMLFKLTISDFPSYKDTIKLFIIASTIPAVINLMIGFFGLSAFSSLIYNFLTPLFVYILYRRHTLEMNEKRKP